MDTLRLITALLTVVVQMLIVEGKWKHLVVNFTLWPGCPISHSERKRYARTTK